MLTLLYHSDYIIIADRYNANPGCSLPQIVDCFKFPAKI